MKLEDIMDQWKQDASIDNTNLGEESLQIPNLHAKYMEIYTKEKKTLRELKRYWKVLFQQRWEVIIAKQGKPPKHNIRLNKTELEKYYVGADEKLQEFEAQINDQEDKVDYLLGVLDTIKNRNWQIKNAIDWSKFQVGMG
jgi:hypothetical protein|tara:strand:+ start:1395 stop:1814 length:420 start_codon:yes stop_codon:yes gene_type:complete